MPIVMFFTTCDKCGREHFVMRVLPTGGGSNLVLCKKCWDAEMVWRTKENERGVANPYEIYGFCDNNHE